MYSIEKKTTETNSNTCSSEAQEALMDATDSSVIATRLSEIKRNRKVLTLLAAFLCCEDRSNKEPI